jgi:hypothetical protein
MGELSTSKFSSIGGSTEPPIIVIIKGPNREVSIYSIPVSSSAILFNKYQELQHMVPELKHYELETELLPHHTDF